MSTDETFKEQPREMTRWTNPTHHAQAITFQIPTKVLIHRENEHGVKVATTVIRDVAKVVVLAPGETKEIPAEFDHAIHHVFCSDQECKSRGARCRSPMTHPGTVLIGGLAPLLQREGQVYGVHRSMIPIHEPKRNDTVAPADVVAHLDRATADDDDPAIAQARARSRASGAA